MLHLKTLKFKNIRCFDSEQSVSFVDREKLIQVDGKNENTGGSSGAGKTTVFLALDYLLGINDIPATLLQSRLTKEPIEVVGEFVFNNTPLTITRGKKTGLIIKTDKETISGNVKVAEEKLDEIIGIPKKIFKKMVHKKQKDGGFFLDMTAKETYEFLVSMLNLDKFILRVDEISTHIKEYTNKIQENDTKKQLLKSSILDLEKVIEEKQKPTNTVDKKEVDALKNNLSNLEGSLTELQIKQKEEIDSIAKPSKEILEFDRSRLSELEKQISESKNKLSNLENARNDLQSQIYNINTLKENARSIGKTIADLKEQKEKIEHNAICPTCQREWVGDSAESQIKKLNVDIANNTNKVLSLKNDIDKEPDLKIQIGRLDSIIENHKSKIDKLLPTIEEEKISERNFQKNLDDKYKVKLAEYHNQISSIKEKYTNEIQKKQNELNECKSEYNQKSYELHSYQTAMVNYEKEISSILSTIDSKKEQLKSLENEHSTLQKNTTIAQEAQRLIKSYVLQTFQETLDLIGNMATDILSAIPNMSTSTIYFEGCKENKDGSLKDEVTAIINIEGNNTVPVKSLSGGERTAIDLAVDLAVIDVIETKAGKGADFFVMDEPFDGLDSVCKENCLEILKQVDTNKKIIMVDHSSELKEMVSDVITVIKNGESSTIAS